MNLAYCWFEAAHWLLSPARAATDVTKQFLDNPVNPLTHTPYARTISAACELFERGTRRYGKPVFGLATTVIDGQEVKVRERVVWERAFGQVIAFDRDSRAAKDQPRLLIVAPMSGHYATLLRGTVEAFLPTHRVMITDWTDARMVPLAEGRFDLDDYIDYLIAMFREFGPDLHVMAVCQPAVPVIAAIARMEAERDPQTPRSMTLMGGPDRYPPLAHRREPARGEARHRVVRAALHHPGAALPAGVLARRLSGLPAVVGLHGHEHRPAHDGALGHVQAPGRRRRRLGREAPGILRRVPRRDGPDRGVLSADRRQGVRAA